jgi:hypothetical protein
MPKMVFFMPTVAAVTTTAGYFLASKMGLITLSPPIVYWISAVLVIVSIMFIGTWNSTSNKSLHKF